MKNKLWMALCLQLFMLSASAQNNNLPLKEWHVAVQTPFVLYISGDGGFNNFSTDLCRTINRAGYSISAINAKSYFWDKKTPEQTATDIATYLQRIFQGRTNQQLILAGYSFGADVMPFIVNRLPDSLRKKLVAVFLLAPSTSTDFEIHWSDIFGGNSKRNMDVVAEINKMDVSKIVTLFGSDETNFPVKKITVKNYSNEYLPGGHHFDGDTEEVGRTMMKYFK
jgi:type IV secretory pathway VirJ component